jgi:glycosyltransferase involved in cell wall biosynthesis
VTSAGATAQPLVSVVTPVYNGAAYIEECIASILEQTYRNWNYVVVDNASTDATPDIVSRYVRRDSRIRHLRFEELVDGNESHNRAFRAVSVQSEFCKVVQADDWLFPDCLEEMIRIARLSDAIGIVSAYRLWDREVDLTGIPYWETVMSGRKILRESLLGRLHVTGAPTSLLYRSHLIRVRDPFYLPTFEHADTEVAYATLRGHDFGFVHQVLTFARRQPGARMSWADFMNTQGAENIRFVLRFGKGVLEPAEYRQRLRQVLWRYLWFHIRQLPKPSRLADARFFALHEAEIENILAEPAADHEVRTAMALVQSLLVRGTGRPRPPAAGR